jgi:hypothetical protein
VPEAGIAMPRPSVDRATFQLDSSSGRFRFWPSGETLKDMLRTGAAYGIGVRFDVRKDGTYTRVFTGRIHSVQISARSVDVPHVLTVECRSLDDSALQNKVSSTQGEFLAYATANKREGEIIADLLTKAGYTDGTDFRSAAWVAANSGTVTVETGNYFIPWMWLDDESILEEIWTIAGACGGSVFTDANGLFHYRASDWWARAVISTQISEYAEASPTVDDRDLYSGVVLELNTREIDAGQVVWQPDAPIVVPPSSTRAVTAKLQNPLYGYSAPDYVATTLGGTAITSDVTATLTVFAQRVEMSFANANTDYAAVIRNLSISGRPVVGTRGEERSFDSEASYWSGRPPRVRSVRGNLYVQSEAHARSMGEFLRDRMESPRRWWRVTGTALPTLELGDPVYIYDTLMGMSSNTHEAHGYVTARQWTATAAGYGETIEYVDREGLFDYALTTPGYFVIGTNKLGAADAARGRLFY